MKRHLAMVSFLAFAATLGLAAAQPVDLPIPAATTSEYPDGISVAETDAGQVYVDAKGRTLYGLDLRTVKRWSPNPALFCKTSCDGWEPILAPADSKPNILYPQGFGRQRRAAMAKLAEQGYHSAPQKAPDWTIIAGPQGPQWVYKGWHMVYSRMGDRPGSTEYDGAENLIWNTLKFVPPVPEVVAPADVAPIFADGSYALAVSGERLLFTGQCKSECSDWEPLAAGMASRGLGDWQVSRMGDVPQWTYRGNAVFVSQSDELSLVPSTGTVLRP
jgi:predicted lipoprotein with Yx(FWY)xxD motif